MRLLMISAVLSLAACSPKKYILDVCRVDTTANGGVIAKCQKMIMHNTWEVCSSIVESATRPGIELECVEVDVEPVQ